MKTQNPEDDPIYGIIYRAFELCHKLPFGLRQLAMCVVFICALIPRLIKAIRHEFKSAAYTIHITSPRTKEKTQIWARAYENGYKTAQKIYKRKKTPAENNLK